MHIQEVKEEGLDANTSIMDMHGVHEVEPETAAMAGESPEEAGADQGHAMSEVSPPADAACKITAAGAAQQASRGLQGAEQGAGSSSGTTAEAFSEDYCSMAQAASTISIAPAYSTLPWDKVGGWPAGMDASDSLDGQGITAASTSAAAAPASTGGASAAPPAHMQLGSMSIRSVTPAPVRGRMSWEKPLGAALRDAGSADADMHASQRWLDLHGYCDAVVHVTASLPKAAQLLNVPEPKGKHAEAASSVHAPRATPQSIVDSVPGAVQQSSGPCHLGGAMSTKQACVQVEQDELTSGAEQLRLPSLSPATPSSGSAGTATYASISAASSAQEPVNLRDVALDRTMPSIWDMDF